MIFLYLKHILIKLIPAFTLLVLPLGLFYHYSTYPLPYIQYVFLGFIFLKDYYFHNEDKARRGLEKKAKLEISKQIGKTPNHKAIVKRINQYYLSKHIANAFNILAIIVLTIIYKKF